MVFTSKLVSPITKNTGGRKQKCVTRQKKEGNQELDHVLNMVLVLTMYICGPAPMAVWSNLLPLIASCLSTTVWIRILAGHMRKLPVTLG